MVPGKGASRWRRRRVLVISNKYTLQVVKDVAFDCDGDTLLIQVEQTGAACHEGYRSCFFRSATADSTAAITEPQLETPEQIYGKK